MPDMDALKDGLAAGLYAEEQRMIRWRMQHVAPARGNAPPTPAGVALRDRVARRWGTKCPCCGVPMHDYKKMPPRSPEWNRKMTIGHDGSIKTGSPRWRWVFICLRCNADQGELRFFGWAYALAQAGDRRAPRVAELARMFDEELGPWPPVKA